MGVFQDITGIRFGRLTVVKRVPNLPNSSQTRWECLCDCGKVSYVSKANLMNGNSKSCGCYFKEIWVANQKKPTHGQSRTLLYKKWVSMKRRCYDKNNDRYQHYGAKGINICKEWFEFVNFYKWAMSNGYSEKFTIDRIDVCGNYEPNNCRWVTIKEQNRNKTTTVYVELNGEKKSLGEWSEILNLPMSTLVSRRNRGRSPQEILNTNYKRQTHNRKRGINS